jgi:hypothetical protein
MGGIRQDDTEARGHADLADERGVADVEGNAAVTADPTTESWLKAGREFLAMEKSGGLTVAEIASRACVTQFFVRETMTLAACHISESISVSPDPAPESSLADTAVAPEPRRGRSLIPLHPEERLATDERPAWSVPDAITLRLARECREEIQRSGWYGR